MKADRDGFVARIFRAALLVVINAAVFLGLFLALELGMHVIWSDGNPLLGPPFAKSKVRIRNSAYGHGLAPNYEGMEPWGTIVERFATNSLGFRDARPRNVSLQSDRKRVLFIGDSFTEAVGVGYEDSFVGRFASAFPQFDVLNAGLSSYAPSAYFAKVKYFLDLGLKVDELIVYIDISDVQDEAINYRFDNNDRLQEGNFDPKCASPEIIVAPPPWWGKWSYVLDFLYKRHLLNGLAKHLGSMDVPSFAAPGGPFGRDRARASWTYDPKAECYGTIGIEGGIAKAIAQMDRLYALAAQHGIPISVGVYPWPQQLSYDDVESRQVAVWRKWCEHKCRRFYNHFPTLFEYKREHPDFLRELFIRGDVHYNPFGNEVIARDLIAQYP
jgi:hypothetical protein